jgi:hypothetical protein
MQDLGEDGARDDSTRLLQRGVYTFFKLLKLPRAISECFILKIIYKKGKVRVKSLVEP